MKDDNFYIRHDQIDNVKQWWWIENENGLWTGPKQNWENSHKEKIEKYVKKRGTVVQAGGGCVAAGSRSRQASVDAGTCRL